MGINWVKMSAGVSVLIALFAVLTVAGVFKALAILAGVS